MSLHPSIFCLLMPVMAFTSALSLSANPMPLPRDANMYLIHEKVTVKLSGQTAVVTGRYKFKIPEGGVGHVNLCLPVYVSPDADKESTDAILISDRGVHKLRPGKENWFVLSNDNAEKMMPGLEGQEVRWVGVDLVSKHGEAKEVEYFIHYRQALSRGRFIYTPLIPNMIPDHDYGTITIKSDNGFKLLDEGGHQFEEAPGQIAVKPAHKRAIIVESHGPRRAWELENEFREKIAIMNQSHRIFTSSFANGLAHEDVVHLCLHGNDRDLLPESYLRWGNFDHRSALVHVLGLETEAHHRAKGVEDGELRHWDDMMSHEPFLKVLEGWSRVDPKAAWQAFSNRGHAFERNARMARWPSEVSEGKLRVPERSQPVAAYPYDLYEKLFAELSRVDSQYAFEQLLLNFPVDAISANRQLKHRIKGFCAGAPDGLNWQRMMERLDNMVRIKNLSSSTKNELAISMLGRWLKDDPNGAVEWFEAGRVKDLHWYDLEEEGRDPFEGPVIPEDELTRKVRYHICRAACEAAGYWNEDPFSELVIPEGEPTKVRRHMGVAAGYWASRDLGDAWKWAREYYPSKPDRFGVLFYLGYQHGKGEAWGEDEIDRALAMDVAKLPEGQRLEFVKDVWVPAWKIRSHSPSFEQHVAACLKSAKVDGDVRSLLADGE